MTQTIPIKIEIPGEGYHRNLVACQAACPVHTDARGYVRAIAAGEYEKAYLIARGPNPLASICGRVCGAPCETACRRGCIPRTDRDGRFIANDRPVAIRALKRFACERTGFEGAETGKVLRAFQQSAATSCANAEEMAALIRAFTPGPARPAAQERIAIIGAGPAGLAAAHDLALMGFRPVIFELEPVPAGMLFLGVPEYRLPRELIRWEVAVIEALGVEIRCNTAVGRDVSFAELRNEYAAVIIAVGAKRSRMLGLPGERGPRVYGGVDFLRAAALNEAIDIGQEAVVIGGGNVAYDVARTVLRQTAEDTARLAARQPRTRKVHLVSLETLEEMPAETLEIREGDEEGIRRINGWGPLEIIRDSGGQVREVLFQRCLKVFNVERRFAPVFDPSQALRIPCDTVLLAAGQTPELSFLETGGTDVAQARPGWPQVDPESLATSGTGVFVAGDLAHGTRLLIDAVASGKKAARSVYQYVTGRTLKPELVEAHVPLEAYRRETGYETLRRVEIPVAPPAERLGRPDTPVETGYTEEQARREASRCLNCGVTPVFDGARCVLCGGCVEVCPTLCLKIVPLAALEQSAELEVLIRQAWTDTDKHGWAGGTQTRVSVPQMDGHGQAQTGVSVPQADGYGQAGSSGGGSGAAAGEACAILKDEDRCIRCALCEMRCPVRAITMERIEFQSEWRVRA